MNMGSIATSVQQVAVDAVQVNITDDGWTDTVSHEAKNYRMKILYCR